MDKIYQLNLMKEKNVKLKTYMNLYKENINENL